MLRWIHRERARGRAKVSGQKSRACDCERYRSSLSAVRCSFLSSPSRSSCIAVLFRAHVRSLAFDSISCAPPLHSRCSSVTDLVRREPLCLPQTGWIRRASNRVSLVLRSSDNSSSCRSRQSSLVSELDSSDDVSLFSVLLLLVSACTRTVLSCNGSPRRSECCPGWLRTHWSSRGDCPLAGSCSVDGNSNCQRRATVAVAAVRKRLAGQQRRAQSVPTRLAPLERRSRPTVKHRQADPCSTALSLLGFESARHVRSCS